MSQLTAVQLGGVTDEFVHAFSLALDVSPDADTDIARFLPCLRALEMLNVDYTIDTSDIDALSTRCDLASEAGECLRLVCMRPDPTREDTNRVGWDSLYQLSARGLDIHIGTATKNFLTERQ
ncbi:hypothetical protein C8R43DRAFT_1116583 [Mycena crocata]|nr:hypothetical protein C8R43DRAFT_1116583 [Mycena crocata]